MIRAACLALTLCLAAPAAVAGVAEEAAKASADLQVAVEALDTAVEAKDRIAALTQTIRAYEQGLGALREALRQAELREAQLLAQFQAKRDRVAQLLGVLSTIEGEPGPMLLLHPDGPLGTVRSGMILSDVTPALQAEAEALKAQLTELRDLRALQVSAGQTLQNGLTAAQEARSALSQAMSDRTELPRRFTEDPQVLRGLLESADTLDAFAAGLAVNSESGTDFTDAVGALELFEWTATAGAAYYQFDLDDNPNFASPKSITTDNAQYMPTDKFALSDYYWRVRIYDADRKPGPFITGQIASGVTRVYLPLVTKQK